MFEELIKNNKVKYIIDLNANKNYYSHWVLKEMNLEKDIDQKVLYNKNIIKSDDLTFYIQKYNTKKSKINSKYYEIKIPILFNEIFPLERNPDIYFINYNSNNEFLLESSNNNSQIISESKIEELKKIIINSDIPEMILYKYKYDVELFEELIDDKNEESNYIIKILRGKNKFIDISNDDIIKCLNFLIDKHKNQLFDIPYIIQKFPTNYNQLFTEEEVTNILTLYDATYIQFQLKKKKIERLNHQLLLFVNNRYNIDYSYIANAENELDLDLYLSYIGFLIIVFNNKFKDKFYYNLMNLNVNINCKKLLQSILEDECDKITEQFCLSPEDVVYNLKILLNKRIENLKEPNNECQLMDICLNKVNELYQKSKKKYHPIQLLQRAIDYHIISLASHPYISKIFYETYLTITTISTYPTEKGKIILNSSHPSYRCKRIKNCPIEQFIKNMKNNENDFSEIYLDIEKCENEGLINVKFDIDLTSKNIEDLVSLLNKAINGFWEEKKEIYYYLKYNDNLSESDDCESLKNREEYKKNILARKIVIKNMIIEKEDTQNFFINNIKKQLHNIAERFLIEKMSKYFYSIISRKYINNDYSRSEDDIYYYSIFFINMNTFCCICVDGNKKIKYRNIFKSYFIVNKENDMNLNKKIAEISELKTQFINHRPKYIIIGINNIGCYQLIESLKEKYNDILIYSDYLSLLKRSKYYENNNDIFNYNYSIAFDQFNFIYNPLEYFMENLNFKYEKNIILNLKLDRLQEQINDIPLLNYCLETQIRRIANLSKFKFQKDRNTHENYFCFMNGLGPITGNNFQENINIIRSISDIKSIFKYNIYKNIEEFIYHDDISMDKDNTNDENYKNQIFIYSLKKEEIFNKIINTYYPFKINNLHNVFVNNIDYINGNINCILFFNENTLQCKLPFNNVPDYIIDKKVFYKTFRILLCKIIDITISENEYSIILSNKIDDLEYHNKISSIEEESYLHKSITGFIINQEEDYILTEIKKLKNIINNNNNNNNKILKKIKEAGYLKNINLKEIKKEYIAPEEYGRFCIRPSFLGHDHLTLTFSIYENLTLNYDIVVQKNESYSINNIEYISLEEIVSNFANKLLKKINEFKNNKYFKSPAQIKAILKCLFDNINYKSNYYKYITFIDDVIIFFMEDSPNYGILFSKIKTFNYRVDYIEILPDGFNFHNKLFENIQQVIDYYYENYEKEYFKEFIYNQIICNIHSQIEDIDLSYEQFEEEIKEESNFNFNKNKQNDTPNKKKLLGKKLKKNEFKEKNQNQDNNKNMSNDTDVWGDENTGDNIKIINNNLSFQQNNNLNDAWNTNNKNDILGVNDNKDNILNNNNDIWGVNNNKGERWGNNNQNDIWNNNKNDIQDNNTKNENLDVNNNKNEDCIINENKNDSWNKDKDNDIKDCWGVIDNKKVSWDVNDNKNDIWCINQNDSSNIQNKNDIWGVNDKKNESLNSKNKITNSNNSSKNNAWGIYDNKKDKCNNDNNNNDSWSSTNNNKNDSWGDNDNKNDSWNVINKSDNKSDYWGYTDKDDDWGIDNLNIKEKKDKKDNLVNNNSGWGNYNRNNNWNSNNKNNNLDNNNQIDNWNNNDKDDCWGNVIKNNSSNNSNNNKNNDLDSIFKKNSLKNNSNNNDNCWEDINLDKKMNNNNKINDWDINNNLNEIEKKGTRWGNNNNSNNNHKLEYYDNNRNNNNNNELNKFNRNANDDNKNKTMNKKKVIINIVDNKKNANNNLQIQKKEVLLNNMKNNTNNFEKNKVNNNKHNNFYNHSENNDKMKNNFKNNNNKKRGWGCGSPLKLKNSMSSNFSGWNIKKENAEEKTEIEYNNNQKNSNYNDEIDIWRSEGEKQEITSWFDNSEEKNNKDNNEWGDLNIDKNKDNNKKDNNNFNYKDNKNESIFNCSSDYNLTHNLSNNLIQRKNLYNYKKKYNYSPHYTKNNNDLKNKNYNLYHKGNNNNKDTNRWKDQLNVNYQMEDVKDDEGEIINFENMKEFGGYNIDYDNDKNNKQKNNNNKKDTINVKILDNKIKGEFGGYTKDRDNNKNAGNSPDIYNKDNIIKNDDGW